MNNMCGVSSFRNHPCCRKVDAEKEKDGSEQDKDGGEQEKDRIGKDKCA